MLSPYAKNLQQIQQYFTNQERWRQILYFCMFIVSRVLYADVFWRFTSHIVETKAENNEKLLIVKFRQNLRHISNKEMLRFLLCSAYNIPSLSAFKYV